MKVKNNGQRPWSLEKERVSGVKLSEIVYSGFLENAWENE